MSADKGSLSCVTIGENTISVFLCVFFHLTTVCFAFYHSVASVYFGRKCRMRKYQVSSISILIRDALKSNVSPTRNPIPTL